MVRLWVLITLVLAACGKPTPRDECDKLVSTGCHQLFDCDPAQAKTLYSSESDCEAQEQVRADCTQAMSTCSYPEAAVNACVDDLKKESCSAAATGQPPASCARAKLCPGEVTCSSVDISAGASGCTYTVEGTTGPCSDGHTYGAHCSTVTSCDCEIDGMPSGRSFNTSSDLCQQTGPQMDQALKTGCGFSWQ